MLVMVSKKKTRKIKALGVVKELKRKWRMKNDEEREMKKAKRENTLKE